MRSFLPLCGERSNAARKQSAAVLPSLARYGVRAVERGNEDAVAQGEAMYTAPDSASIVALRATDRQCKFSLGGSKGGISLF